MKRFRMAALAAVLLALTARLPARADSGAVCRTAEQFRETFTAHTDRLEESFTISLSDEMAALLFDLEQPKAKPLLSDMTNNCGIFSYRWGYVGEEVRFSDIVYYPGKYISFCARNGTEGRLTEAERRTLEKARAVLRQTKGLDGRDQVLRIHDLLCGMITYCTDDDPWNENDWAVGALLDGKADCDGYADAFCLCCSLAGFGVYYQHGYSLSPDRADDTTHMWNIVCIDGRWVFVDVTWDDQEEYVSHLYYAMGADTASRFYQWNREAAAVPVAQDTDTLRASLGLPVHDAGSWEAVYALLRADAEGARAAVTVRLGDAVRTADAEERLGSLAFQTGAKRYSLSGENGLYEITVTEWYPSFTFCDAEADLERIIAERAAAGDRTFTILFAPALSEKMFADGQALLEYHLCGTRLSSPVGYLYSAESGRVTFTDARYYGPDEPRAVKDCSALTWDDVYAFFRDSLSRRCVRCGVILPRGVSAEDEAVREKAANLIHSCGSDSFRYAYAGGFLAVYDISYYPCFAVCDTAEEMEAFIAQRAAAGDRYFSVIFAPGLSEKMFADERAMLDYHLCAGRLASPMNYKFNDVTGRVTFSEAQYYGPDEQRFVKDCSALSWEGVYDFVRTCLARRCVRFGVILPQGDSMKDQAVRSRFSDLVWSLGAADYSWSYGDRFVSVYGLRYYPCFTVCDTAADLETFIAERAARGDSGFTVYFTPALSEKMFAGGRVLLDYTLCRTRVRCSYRYNESAGRVAFSDAEYYGPDELRFAKDCSALSWDDVYIFLRDSLSRRCVRCGVILPAGESMEDEAVRERLSNLVWGCGAERFSWSYEQGYAEIYNIEYCGEFAVCGSRQEILSCIRSFAEKGIHTFRICLDPSIGPEYFADGLKKLKAVLEESLLKPPYTYQYSSSSYYISLEDIDFR